MMWKYLSYNVALILKHETASCNGTKKINKMFIKLSVRQLFLITFHLIAVYSNSSTTILPNSNNITFRRVYIKSSSISSKPILRPFLASPLTYVFTDSHAFCFDNTKFCTTYLLWHSMGKCQGVCKLSGTTVDR